MMMYCRDCGKNVKTRKEKAKNNYTKEVYYFCKECGVIVLTMYENRSSFEVVQGSHAADLIVIDAPRVEQSGLRAEAFRQQERESLKAEYTVRRNEPDTHGEGGQNSSPRCRVVFAHHTSSGKPHDASLVPLVL